MRHNRPEAVLRISNFSISQRLGSKFLGVSKHYNSEFAFRVANSYSIMASLKPCFLKNRINLINELRAVFFEISGVVRGFH